MVSNAFMATSDKCNQPNHCKLIQVSCFPLPILENLFLRIVSLSLFIFWLQRVICIKTQLVGEESWQ